MDAEQDSVVLAEDTQAELGIFKLNSKEWWAARSIEEALTASSNYFKVPPHEILDELSPPYRLSEQELWSCTLDQDGSIRPFMVELTRRISEGYEFPHLFGTCN